MKLLIILIAFAFTNVNVLLAQKSKIANMKSLSKKKVLDLLNSGAAQDSNMVSLEVKYGVLADEYQSSFTHYNLPSGEYLLVDKSDSTGLLYDNRKTYYDFAILPHIKWAEIEKEDIFTQFDNYNLNFLEDSEEHLKKISAFFKIDSIDFDFSEASILKVEKLINTSSNYKNSLKDIFLELYYYLGECFRRKVDGKWYFLKSKIFTHQLNLFIEGKRKREYYLWIPIWQEIKSENREVDFLNIIAKNNPYYKR
jgi:hypothetical protein